MVGPKHQRDGESKGLFKELEKAPTQGRSPSAFGLALVKLDHGSLLAQVRVW